MARRIALLVCLFASLGVEGQLTRPIFRNKEPQGSQRRPMFLKSYTVKGVMTAPDTDSGAAVDVTVHVDAQQNSSRVDYLSGAIQTYQFPGNEKHGVEFVVMDNKCYSVQSTSEEPVKLQNTLPNLTDFHFKDSERVGGVFAERWERVNNDSGILYGEKYTMYVRSKGALSGSSIPIRYSVERVDKVHFIMTDEYFIDYSEYKPLESDSGVFKLHINTDDCQEVRRAQIDTKVMAKLKELRKGKQ